MLRQFCAAATGLLCVAVVGCTPPPATQPPNQQERIEIDVDRDAERGRLPPAEQGVDVQIGGGEGVDVEVNPEQPGAEVDVGDDVD